MSKMYMKSIGIRIFAILNRYQQAVLTILTLMVVSESFLVKDASDARVFGFLVAYLLCIKLFKLQSNFTFFLSLVALGCMYIQFIISKASVGTEKAAVLLFFLMLIGIVQQLRD